MTRSSQDPRSTDTKKDYQLPPTSTPLEPISVTFVTSSGCHFCEMAKDTIAEAATTYPLEVDEIDIATPTGAAIMRANRVPYPPVLVIDGRFHAFGRISAKRFRRHLDAITKER
jgi:glutaredoxin